MDVRYERDGRPKKGYLLLIAHDADLTAARSTGLRMPWEYAAVPSGKLCVYEQSSTRQTILSVRVRSGQIEHKF